MSTSNFDTRSFVVPSVESLAIRVVVDSSYDRFLPKTTHDLVQVDHVRGIRGREMSTLAGEWGLSLHLVSETAGEKAQYLLDFGYTPEILIRNFDLLGIDASRINGLILSHGHRDHFGGLDGFIDQHRDMMRDDIDLYVGSDTAFREKWIKQEGDAIPGETAPEDGMISWGALDQYALAERHVHAVCCDAPHALTGAFTTGYIERDSFEKVTGGTKVEEDNDHFTEAERRGELVLDQHPDEHGTCYNIQGRGLVVISSCGHSGIVNTVRTAMAVSNSTKLHAVIGGFHLGLSPMDYIAHTVDALAELDPDVIIPMHCSGPNFIHMMRERMPDRVIGSNLGSLFTFGI